MREDHGSQEGTGHPREWYETLLETIRDGVYTLDDAGRITWVNEIAVTEFDLGYSRDELMGKHVALLLSQADLAKCQAIISNLRKSETRESGRCEIALQTNYGTEIPVELHLALLPSPDGEFRGTAGVVRDITRRKQREQWLQVLNRLFRHNLRNQINIITGRIEVFEDDLTPEARHHLEAINEAIQHLVDLSEKTVQVRTTLMDAEWTHEAVDAVEITTSVCQEFQQQAPAAEISVEAPETAWVQADPSLAIVLENLLENAIEHTDRASPTISVSIRSITNQSDEWIEIKVTDDGPGIPPTDLKAITSGEVTPLQHGSGLGLWLVKWLVERYGGDLGFTDRAPRGTTITIRLPSSETARN